MARFTIKKGDLLPALTASLKNPDGSVFALTAPGTTVKYGMELPGSASPKVDAAASILDAANGVVAYNWAGSDTDTVGTFAGEFQVTDNSGKKRTFPNSGYLAVDVVDDIAS